MIKSGLVIETDSDGKSPKYPPNFRLVVEAHKTVISDALPADPKNPLMIQETFYANACEQTTNSDRVLNELYYDVQYLLSGDTVDPELLSKIKLDPQDVRCVLLSPRTQIYNSMLNLNLSPQTNSHLVAEIAGVLADDSRISIDGDKLLFAVNSFKDYTDMLTAVAAYIKEVAS